MTKRNRLSVGIRSRNINGVLIARLRITGQIVIPLKIRQKMCFTFDETPTFVIARLKLG